MQVSVLYLPDTVGAKHQYEMVALQSCGKAKKPPSSGKDEGPTQAVTKPYAGFTGVLEFLAGTYLPQMYSFYVPVYSNLRVLHNLFPSMTPFKTLLTLNTAA